MNRDPILFRVDGTAATGYERFYRCLALATALQRRRRPTYFLGRLDPASLAFVIRRGGHDWIPANHAPGTPEDLAETLQQIHRLQPAAVFVDAADAEEGYLKELLAAGPTLVSVDHQARGRFPSRLLINPLLGPGRDAYDHASDAQLLLGSRFALVRPEVRRARPLRSREPAQPFRVLVALGDDDPRRQTANLAKLVMNCPRVGRVDAAVRPHHPGLPALQEMAEAYPGRLEIATEPAEVTYRLSRCHLAVTAGNGWSVELACVGIPQILVVQDPAHEPTARRLEEEGVAVCLGLADQVTPAQIRQAIATLLTDPEERQSMSRSGRRLIDGRGPDRLVIGTEILLHSRRDSSSSAAA